MKMKNGLEKNSISGGKNIKKKMGAVKRKTIPFLVVILMVTSALCYGYNSDCPYTVTRATDGSVKYPAIMSRRPIPPCLYSSNRTMEMLTTPNQWDVNSPPANGWTTINVIPDDDADNSAWGIRFPDKPWHAMYFEGAHWVYGNVHWKSPESGGHEYYRIPLTVQGGNCVALHFKAYVDDTAKFYITGPGYSTPTLFYTYPASISMDEHDPQEFTIDCLQPGDYTIYIDHQDIEGQQYGLIFTAECVSCPCPCEPCLYSSNKTMEMLTTPNQWDVNSPPANGWTTINVIPDDDADNSHWGIRFPDKPWHAMYFEGAHWVYGNVHWDTPATGGHEYYRIPLTVQGGNCVALHFKAYVDDTAKFYITGPGYSTP
ncbi:MAG: hypothetical protein PVF58_18620, partial [Candidatus Methanofastidiosia archaeon]